MGAEYDSAVRKTFTERLRTVFLVDDAFPKYSDIVENEKYQDVFGEWERAHKLYKAFHDLHLPCDIENSFETDDETMIERLRKCDLIVLDYLLDGEHGGSSKSIGILRHLSDSPHFNTVVVYTKNDLDEVWLDIAANLRPDLRLGPFLNANEIEADWWAGQNKEDYIEIPPKAGLAVFLTGGMSNVRKDDKRPLKQLLREKELAGETKGSIDVIAELIFRAAVDDKRSLNLAEADEKVHGVRSLQGRLQTDGPLWLQCRGCFIAVVGKKEVEDEAQQLMSSLNAALLDWKPNFLQILVSEIQNNLELELVAADPKFFSDVVRQVGLSHYLLQQLAADNDPDSAIESLVDRVVETLRSRMSGETKLREFAAKVLADIRAGLGAEITGPKPIDNAIKFAHVDRAVDPLIAVGLLNAFLSTEPFARSRITTGTVFKNGKDYWMVASPSCDLTGRAPSGQQWMMGIHPVRSFTAVRLATEKLSTALKVATHGKHAFIVHESEPLCLTVFDSQTSAPDTETFFADDTGKIVYVGDVPTFRAHRVQAGPQFSAKIDFVVIGQLRPGYADRVLQMTGFHLGRIGIDFFTVGGVRDGE
jgi:hypothetical protein